MPGVVIRVVLAVALLVAGAALWAAGQFQQRAAAAHRYLTVLRYDDAVRAYDELTASPVAVRAPWVASALVGEIPAKRAAAKYWLESYDGVSGKSSAAPDPDVVFLAANASYRRATSTLSPQELERVIKAYAEVLKASPGHADAAFNYEYLVRMREEAVRKREARIALSEPPPGATLHGHVGAPPKGTDMGRFKIVVPNRGEERQEDPEAGSGRERVRKG